MEHQECVSFLLVKRGYALLETRSRDKETDPGVITIPGGHMESGETQLATLTRELTEELCISPKHHFYLCSLYHPTAAELQLIHYYVVTEWAGQLRNQEAETVEWYPLNDAPVQLEADKVALSEFVRIGGQLSYEPAFFRR
ncbi:NUDIX hydrolase [Grimontia sp. NTOU-MAR1]|uniref:NUDIX hydrolase n=1 Tax=Grimontia sp. NTOU-MAR1 TaxID=3111011 RepID=UPI002DB88CDE|nr:NUDIX domain-containing protein [Grimontia sp. NTOU-MAR1]WRW00314.1 NUDIX domain-containing protein [Grimontia sp. NTOU-MAR1]